MVTVRSFIDCSSADWVLGGARLISSASSSWVKIGPLVSTKLLVWKLNRLVPSISPGIRSGVNWMRPNLRSMPAAKEWASSVLAVPGTPSSSTWPPTSRLVSISSTTSSCPTIALRTSVRRFSATFLMSCRSIDYFLFPITDCPRQRDQLGGVGSLRQGELVGLVDPWHDLGFDPARPADALEPSGQLA